MEQSYYENFCHVFHQLTSCPISLLRDNTVVLSVPKPPFAFADSHKEELFAAGETICYTISESYLYYGLVKSRTDSFSYILGPYAFYSCTHTDILNILKEYCLPSELLEAVTDFLQFGGNKVASYFASLLAMANFAMNQERLDIEFFHPVLAKHHMVEIARQCSDAIMDVKESQFFHNTYQLEQMLYKKVELGDSAYFKNPNPTISNLVIGRIADDNIRQLKNLFIVSATLTTRAAIRGGLDMETAYQLSDKYIQTVEHLSSPDAINALSTTMLVDFTERVAASKIPVDITPEIYNALQYIQLHTNFNISVQDVADSVNLSRSHLSRRFKAELGFDISSFIMRCKLEEAKSLLSYTDKSLSEISTYLCFSSQSYFNNVFKQKYGITPKEYRINTHKSAAERPD